MNVTPVRNYREPRYPSKEKVMENPDILKSIPQRWKGNLYVGAAFSTLLVFSLTSCVQKGTGDTGSNSEAKEVAPVFEHGSGRGSFGCVSVAPPAFLSEEEAFQVIQEELNSYNIKLEKNTLTIENIKVPETKYYLHDSSIDTTVKRNLELDGYDKEKKIAFEFISEEDYANWQGEEEVASSVSDYDFLATAKMLQNELGKQNKGTNIGIFYDPMTKLSQEEREEIIKSEDWNSLRKRAWEMTKEDLRRQVRDFIEWLKGQGVI
jgi:hypothetical protein